MMLIQLESNPAKRKVVFSQISYLLLLCRETCFSKVGHNVEKEQGADEKSSRSAHFSGTTTSKCSLSNLRFHFLSEFSFWFSCPFPPNLAMEELPAFGHI